MPIVEICENVNKQKIKNPKTLIIHKNNHYLFMCSFFLITFLNFATSYYFLCSFCKYAFSNNCALGSMLGTWNKQE